MRSAAGLHKPHASAARKGPRAAAQLPQPMRDAAGTIGTDIVTLAEAETFIAGLRTQALAPAAEANP